MGKYKKGELQREKLYISMRRQSSSIPFLWDGSIHSESASPVTPSNQIRLRSTRSDWKTRGSPWAASPLPARASQSPEHCMAGATAGPGQDPTLAPPPVGSCFSRGRYSGTEPTAGAAAGLCPGVSHLQCTHQPAWAQTSPHLFIQTGAERMFSRMQEQRRGL